MRMTLGLALAGFFVSCAAAVGPARGPLVSVTTPPVLRPFAVLEAAPKPVPPLGDAPEGDPPYLSPAGAYAPHEVAADSAPTVKALCQRIAKDRGTDKMAQLTCYQTGGAENGVWALAVASPTQEGGYSSWRLAYTQGTGRVLQGVGCSASADGGDPAVAGNDAPSVATVLAVLDLDGDGRSELITNVTRNSDVSGHTYNNLEIWTPGKDNPVPFPATAKYHLINVVDSNADGRPELIEDPYDLTFGGSLGWVRSKSAWSLLLELDEHGNPTNDGALSRAYALALCPSELGLLEWIPKLPPDALAQAAHCASLWGLPAKDSQAAIEQYCANEPADAANWCDASSGSWEAIAAAKPPFVLQVPVAPATAKGAK